MRCDQHPLVFTDDLVFHTLELPKFERSKSEISGCSAIEKWLSFLKHAEHAEAAELVQRLVDPEFEEAVGVLNMISRAPEERQLYEARIKFLHDEEARMMAARMEGMEQGREKGREEGEQIGQFKVYQQLLGLPETSSSELQRLSPVELTNMIADLQQQLRDRGSSVRCPSTTRQDVVDRQEKENQSFRKLTPKQRLTNSDQRRNFLL